MTDIELTEFVTRWCEEKPPVGKAEWNIVGAGCSRDSPKGFWKLKRNAPGAEGRPKWVPAYDFATSRDACALFEALLEERNVAEKYEDALISVIEEHNAGEDVSEEERQGISLFDGVTATAHDRCKALARMAGGGDAQTRRPCVGGQVWNGDELLTCSRCGGGGCGGADE